MSHEYVLPSDMGYGVEVGDASIGPCTCGCPDGEGQHLENCEAYLRYWELDQLDAIVEWVSNLKNPMAAKYFVQCVLGFARSVAELGDACISDPQGVICRRIEAMRSQTTEYNGHGPHAHRWNDDDVCSICGADGRS